MYRIKLTEPAAEILKSFEATARTQIIRNIEQLKDDPALLGKPLAGPLKEFRSVRAAGQRYRIIYRIDEETRQDRNRGKRWLTTGAT